METGKKPKGIMYNQFVQYYDSIFPLKKVQTDFVKRHSIAKNRYLDIGCGTGALAASLVSEFSEVVAMDYSSEMVEAASNRTNQVSYSQGDMRSFKETVSGNFDLISCFGNTLVHLSSAEEIGNFFKDVKSKLTDEGVFLFQIVNFDRVLEKRPKQLAQIDNGKICFTRMYHYDTLPHVRFETELLIKESGNVIKGEVPLFGVQSEMVKKLLLENGFEDVCFYGSFNDTAFDSDSAPLIVRAK